MPVHFIKDKKRWEFTFNRVITGTRQRATKLLPEGWSRAQAQAYDQAETARLFAVATGGKSVRRTIDDAVEIYCREVLPKRKNHKATMAELNGARWAYAGRFIDELPEVANEYREQVVNEKTGEPLAPASIRNRLAYIRAACRYAFKKHNFCEHDPAERLIMPEVKNERHFYSKRGEVLQIARQIQNKSVRVAILTAFYSGMRLSEMLRCRVEDRHFVLDDTKNGTRRIVPIHYKLTSYLKRFPITARKNTIQTNHRRACDALGLPHLHLHDLRHSAASAMINEGVSLNTVGAVLGHMSAESTRRYAHLQTDTLADAVALIGKRRMK